MLSLLHGARNKDGWRFLCAAEVIRNEMLDHPYPREAGIFYFFIFSRKALYLRNNVTIVSAIWIVKCRNHSEDEVVPFFLHFVCFKNIFLLKRSSLANG